MVGCRKVIPLEVVAGCGGDRAVGAYTLVGEVYPVVPASVGCCSSVLMSKIESSILHSIAITPKVIIKRGHPVPTFPSLLIRKSAHHSENTSVTMCIYEHKSLSKISVYEQW